MQQTAILFLNTVYRVVNAIDRVLYERYTIQRTLKQTVRICLHYCGYKLMLSTTMEINRDEVTSKCNGIDLCHI